MSSMISGINWVDILFTIILLFIAYQGSRTGLGCQLVNLFIWLILLFFAMSYYDGIAAKLLYKMDKRWAEALSFSFIVIIFGAFSRYSRVLFFGGAPQNIVIFEKIAGALAAAVRGALILGIIGTQLLLLPISFFQESVAGSRTGMIFVDINARVYSQITRYLRFQGSKSPDAVVKDIYSGLR